METLTPATAPTVMLELEGPRPQRRATVAFRLLLAIPHLVWAWLLSIAVGIAVFAAWVAALVLGRMPDGLGTFIGRVLQYFGRVGAYLLLLTDRYPSFALDEADYPVSVVVPRGGRLNRAAVLFRLVLLVPVAIAATLVSNGLTICIVFIWLIVLVAGQLSPSLFEALAAALRYWLRFTAFAYMLTSEYPRGLFGDRGLAADTSAAPPAADAVDGEPSTTTPRPEPDAGGGPPLGPRPLITKLVLSKVAKRIVVLFIAVGIVSNVGLGVVVATQISSAGRARTELSEAYSGVYQASLAYSNHVQGCAANQGGLPCLRDAALQLQSAFNEFRTRLATIHVPASMLGAVHDVDQHAAAVVDALKGVAGASDAAQYQARTSDLQQRLESFDQSVQELDRLLSVGS